MNKPFLVLGTGERISKAECKKLKEAFAEDVINHWDEFTHSLTDKQRKQLEYK